MAAVQYNPFGQRFRTDPYPLYQDMRQTDPVQWNTFLQLWVLTSYRDCSWVLNDTRFSADRRTSQNPFAQAMVARQEEFGPLGQAPTMLGADPPDHTRLRRLTSKAFTPRRAEDLRPRIADISDNLLESAAVDGHIDVVRGFAYPLPMIVIAELLGVPPSDRDIFKRWSSDIAATLGAPFVPPAVLEQGRQSIAEMTDYFRSVIRKRKHQPQDDLISALIAAEEQQQTLSEDELLSTCMLLLIAGNETTTNLIGNGVLTLLKNPDQLLRLQREPSLLNAAIEECLRYECPVQATSRVVTEATEVNGKTLLPGQVVIVVLGAANRDPAAFPNPEQFDIARTPNPHLVFGDGIHFCLGAPLARAEAQIAIGQLAQRFPRLRLEEQQPQWANSFVLRGLQTLSVGI